jgi:hypothetical protein
LNCDLEKPAAARVGHHDSTSPRGQLFYYECKDAFATGSYASVGTFRVEKDSTIARDVVPSMSLKNRQKREELIRRGVIKDKDGKLTFLEDSDFQNPSEAAGIVGGNNEDGWLMWKNRNGTLDKVLRNGK